MELFVKNLRFTGRHGLYDDERRNGRDFRASLFVTMPDLEGAKTDRIDETVDYRMLANIVRETSTSKRCDLIEHLGHRILNRVFEEIPVASEARIRIEKQATGIAGSPEWVGIELESES